jgi:signal peptidase I
MKDIIRDVLITVVIAVVIFLGLRAIVQTFEVDLTSMEPNFQAGDRVLVNKLVYHLHPPQRGDVIVFVSPHAGQGDLIKRVMGLPGESVDIKDGKVYIHKTDGQVIAVEEPYITAPARADFNGSVIPANQYFVLGDNRNVADDSRYGWLVPKENIIGKAWLLTWPPHAWGLAANYRFAQ